MSSLAGTNHSFTYHIYGLSNKKLGLGNIVITGELTTTIKVIKGDVNGDGLVNITDVVCLVNYILDSDSIGIILEAADMNEDGEVNITDVVALVDYVLVSD